MPRTLSDSIRAALAETLAYPTTPETLRIADLGRGASILLSTGAEDEARRLVLDASRAATSSADLRRTWRLVLLDNPR